MEKREPSYTVGGKGNYKQGERQPSEWKKIIANEATDKGLI